MKILLQQYKRNRQNRQSIRADGQLRDGGLRKLMLKRLVSTFH